MTEEQFTGFTEIVAGILLGCVLASVILLMFAIIIVIFFPHMW